MSGRPTVVTEPPDASTAEAVVCGAGAAGLSSAAMLERLGVSTVILEGSDQVGSSWRSRYDGLRLNTLGWMSTQPGYHGGYGPRHFPTRDEWVRYLEGYAARHALRIRFDTDVVRIDRDTEGWRVESSDGAFTCRLVVVATGHDREPTIPDWPGRESFTGELIHAAEYRNPEPFRNRDVLVVGPNVTGSELAFFLADGGARRVRVAARTPPNILRRCRLGLPLNPTAVLLDHLPARLGDRMAGLTQRLTFGDLSTYGLPRPRLGVVSTNRERRQGPVIDDGFVGAVKRGDIEIVAGVEALDRADVVLSDGCRIQPDVVIAATGYSRGLEPLVGQLGLLDDAGYPTVLGGDEPSGAPGLYFVGYATPLSGQLRGIRRDAKRMARAAVRSRNRARQDPRGH